ncbi:MAG: polyprenyl synthetase family protein [candidate division WOR-3 bacterium]|nr:polyprenyl synthetase family protein [candidate division WOR-3 bacterium]MCX7836536.1 polyprenyl synthetase family protein [candidate division WOR-3 bacterium]MDW8113774.1 polyprenyl synthetase family protein [candidate division WOR-3 bacterium]
MKERKAFERFLKKELKKYTKNYPLELKKGIFYALSGGKRIRPLLLLSLLDKKTKIKKANIMKIALAIELIHNFSLVHDDLPAIDNDDYRRGRLTTHKVFGEGEALLIGDALFSLAFQILGDAKIESSLKIEILKILTKATTDLVCGEFMDIKKKNFTKKEYEKVIKKKTAALFRAIFQIAALLLNMKDKKRYALLGENYGSLFQIEDDIKDKENYPFLLELKRKYEKRLKNGFNKD